jgi:hypothetical protein
MIRTQQPYLNRSAYRRRWTTRAVVSSARSIEGPWRRGVALRETGDRGVGRAPPDPLRDARNEHVDVIQIRCCGLDIASGSILALIDTRLIAHLVAVM